MGPLSLTWGPKTYLTEHPRVVNYKEDFVSAQDIKYFLENGGIEALQSRKKSLEIPQMITIQNYPKYCVSLKKANFLILKHL